MPTFLELPKNLISYDDYYQYKFDFFHRGWYTETVRQTAHVRPDVYDWLNENVGDRLYCYRKLERIVFVKPTQRELRDMSDNMTEWETFNPKVLKTAMWDNSGNKLSFRQADHAALFKLTWF